MVTQIAQFGATVSIFSVLNPFVLLVKSSFTCSLVYFIIYVFIIHKMKFYDSIILVYYESNIRFMKINYNYFILSCFLMISSK